MLIYLTSFLSVAEADHIVGVDVITNSAFDITEDSAVLEGEITSIGEQDHINVSFQYRESNSEDWKETQISQKSSEGIFRRRITDLNSSTNYEYKAIAEEDGVTEEGSILSFETLPKDSIFTVDLSDTSNLIFVILISSLAIFLFLIGQPLYTSAITTFLGFIFLNSQMNELLSILVIAIGVVIAFIGGNNE